MDKTGSWISFTPCTEESVVGAFELGFRVVGLKTPGPLCGFPFSEFTFLRWKLVGFRNRLHVYGVFSE